MKKISFYFSAASCVKALSLSQDASYVLRCPSDHSKLRSQLSSFSTTSVAARSRLATSLSSR